MKLISHVINEGHERLLFSTPAGRVGLNLVNDGDEIFIIGVGASSTRNLTNKVGAAGMLKLFRTLATRYPQAQVAYGDRVSGAFSNRVVEFDLCQLRK